jgi:hypothetical protein
MMDWFRGAIISVRFHNRANALRLTLAKRDVLAVSPKSTKSLCLQNVFRRRCDGRLLSINCSAARLPDQDQTVHVI